MQNPDANDDAEAVERCNLDCFATGRCTCQPDPNKTGVGSAKSSYA